MSGEQSVQFQVAKLSRQIRIDQNGLISCDEIFCDWLQPFGQPCGNRNIKIHFDIIAHIMNQQRTIGELMSQLNRKNFSPNLSCVKHLIHLR